MRYFLGMKNLIKTLAIVFALSLLSGFATAQNVLPPPDESETEVPIQPPEKQQAIIQSEENLDALFAKLRNDPNIKTANGTARAIWREWTASGSKSIDLLMSWAGAAMGRSDFAKAEDLLDQGTVLAPDYAEGWNRRATLYFQKSDLSRSIADIETTLSLEPRHFGALSGLAVILNRLDRKQEALDTWYKVLEIYPANQTAQKAVIDLEEELAGSNT